MPRSRIAVSHGHIKQVFWFCFFFVCVWKSVGCSVISDSWPPHGLYPLSMEFSRQEHWSGLPFPSPRDFPNPRVEPRSPALQADSLLSEPPWWKAQNMKHTTLTIVPMQFSGTKCICTAVSLTIIYYWNVSHTQTEALSPVNTNSPPPWHLPSDCEFDYTRSLASVKSSSICLYLMYIGTHF